MQEGEQRENKKEGGRNAGERRRMCTKKETEEDRGEGQAEVEVVAGVSVGRNSMIIR